MGSGMPEIGSRISLISKADIRYEGKLFSVDPDECTIALSSVRSYGTEDRKTTYPVPAQHQVYDFILFRGSDIKDIRVLTTTIPNDPAIVQLSVPPSLSTIESQFESADGDFRVPGVAGTSTRIAAAPGSSSRPSQTFQNSGFKSTSVFTNLDQVMKHPVPNAVSEDGSRSSTPSGHAKNSEAPARTSVSSNKSDDASQQQQRKQQPYGNRDMNRSQPHYQNRYQNQQQGNNKPQYQQRYQQNRYPQQQQQQQQQSRYPQQSQYRDYNNRVDYNNGRADYNNQYRNYANDYRDSYGQRQHMQPLRGNVQRSDNWVNYNQRRMNRPGQGLGSQNNYQSAGGYQNQNRRPRNTLKFDEEYDFEQANSEFEEVRQQMSKIKIEDADGGVKVNGDAEKKEDSGNEVSGGEENDHEAENAKEQCYDKVKSFFDNISYEAIERSKGLTQRLDWKTERKINSETFGQVALRRNLNNYRRRMNNNGGQGGNGYYQNYQNNRNQGMQNNYRTGGYNNRMQQGNRPRRQFNPTGDHEDSKENQVAA